MKHQARRQGLDALQFAARKRSRFRKPNVEHAGRRMIRTQPDSKKRVNAVLLQHLVDMQLRCKRIKNSRWLVMNRNLSGKGYGVQRCHVFFEYSCRVSHGG